uniref:HEAT repeat domain-containing protein n=1 Tax=Desulfacinum infernum TaxID=35837 RepID=A0A832A3L4_9BACT
MDLEALYDVPAWEWPEGTKEKLLALVQNRAAPREDRDMAAELLSDVSVMDDGVAEALLNIAADPDEDPSLRGTAAVALGSALEYADVEGFDDPEEAPITETTFQKIQQKFYELYHDPRTPTEVRRSVLEGSVRAPQAWHRDAVASAYASKDSDWKLTAVFAMRWIEGFDREILEALQSRDPDILYQAVCAAGAWGISEAAPVLENILGADEIDEDLLFAAIEAVATVMPERAPDVLEPFRQMDDPDIVDAVEEALAMAKGILSLEDDGNGAGR